LLVLSLVILRYVDEARLPESLKLFVANAAPTAAILIPCAYFFSVLTPSTTRPNGWIYLAFVGAALLFAGLFILGVGLLRAVGGAQDQ
jgi:hypothetical protein